ncbi:MAG TPA: glycosyltransferase family 2 protein [Candidatus Saccharimonadales bacterium]|nr:glycosyltransferase family 2 protein [Candidatus Saccharimonadales bacterium]
MKLSAIIIAKNAEDLISDCLKSISFCDEIIVVDGGSTDKTNNIAKKFHAKVITGDTINFAGQRNIGLQHASGEWVLYIDTDERVSPSLREEIIKYAGNPRNQYQAYKIKRKNFYFGNHEWPQIEKLERLFKRENLKKWEGRLHESPIIVGEVGELDGYLLHYTHRDLTSMLQKTIIWSQVEAELRFKNNHPQMTWWRFPRVMLTAFWDSYIRQQGYKAGTAGMVESIYQAFSIFITYARLWEMQKEK